MEDYGTLIDRIRKQVITEAEQKFADETFQHLRCSLYNARMRDADAASCISGECGCAMEIYLKFRHGLVEKATYMTDGDTNARLCGSCVADLAIGKNSRQLLRLSAVDILNRLGRKGVSVEQCALLALSALHKAARQHGHGGGYREGQEKKTTSTQLFISAGGRSSHLTYDN